MEIKLSRSVFDRIDETIPSILAAARIPGAAIAIVAGGDTVHAKGYGYRDLKQGLAMSNETLFPIGSTTKALTTTMIGTLIDEGRLAWDKPVHHYTSQFCLIDSVASSQSSLRDLLSMRTGLPRHDWVWLDNSISLQTLTRRLRFLEPSCGFRERYQYNNLGYLVAAHIAESVSERTWCELLSERIMRPLEMRATAIDGATSSNITMSYTENRARELYLAPRLDSTSAAAAGGTIYSTVIDMSAWLRFNLGCESVTEGISIHPETLREIHSPVIAMGNDSVSPSRNAAYGLGYCIDTYNGHARLSHTGYLHNVHSEVALYPDVGIGLVCFTNFGALRLSRFLNQRVFDLLMGLESPQTLEDQLMVYEKKIEANRDRLAAIPRLVNTNPAYGPQAYTGHYWHPGYGSVDIDSVAGELTLQFRSRMLALEHWQHESWVITRSDLVEIQEPHPFDRGSRITFEKLPAGINALNIQFEPAVAPIRFEKTR